MLVFVDNAQDGRARGSSIPLSVCRLRSRRLLVCFFVARVFGCVGRFMDAAAQEFVPVVILGNLAPAADEVGYAPKKKNYRPSLASWMVAWDRYAMAADILQQLNFRDSRVHRMHITEVRASANALGCGALICLIDCVRSK